MKRAIDIILCILCIVVLSIPFFVIVSLVFISSRGEVLHWSRRIGKDNREYFMPKIRTMQLGAPNVATHLLKTPKKYLTSMGPFLRRTSLDEIPQVWSILKGDMSFVGPRPALYNQYDLIKLRTNHGVHKLLPGLTGLAQISGRDDLPISKKVEKDILYLKKQSIFFDFKIILLTFRNIVFGKDISH